MSRTVGSGTRDVIWKWEKGGVGRSYDHGGKQNTIAMIASQLSLLFPKTPFEAIRTRNIQFVHFGYMRILFSRRSSLRNTCMATMSQ